jgi:predicted DsbA family dithiol-disulfide isomerase
MHTRLFENQQSLEPFNAHADAVGLDVDAFQQCMTVSKHAPDVRRDMAEAQKAGLTSTPAFLLAITDPKNPKQVKGLSLLRGAQPFEKFKAEIDQALAAAGG